MVIPGDPFGVMKAYTFNIYFIQVITLTRITNTVRSKITQKCPSFLLVAFNVALGSENLSQNQLPPLRCKVGFRVGSEFITLCALSCSKTNR